MATRVVFSKEQKTKNAVLIVGLPGIGLVGKICVDYFIKELKPAKVGKVFSDTFPPSVHTRDGVVELISDDWFLLDDSAQPVYFLAGPVQPNLDFRVGSNAEHYEFANEIATTAKRLGIQRIITLAGINVGDARLEKEPGVIIAATSSKLIPEFTKLGGSADKKEGLISGAAGLILGLALEQGIEGVCLMGETSTRLVYGDPAAAKRVLEMLTKKFGWKVNLDQITAEAKNIQDAFKQLNQQMQDPEGEGEETAPENGLSYVQ